MKRGHFLFALGFLAFIAVATLFFMNQQGPLKPSEPSTVLASFSASNTSPREPTEAQLTAPNRITQDKQKEEIIKEFFSKQIDFYGLVEDGDGNPVGGANVEYSVYSNWLSPNPKVVLGLQSDGIGHFSITGKQGASIFVKVTHLDYYETGQSYINLSFAQPVEPLPSAARPFIFVLRKKGDAEPLLREKQVLRNVPKDGRAVQVGLTGERAGDIAVQAWTSPRAQGAANNAPFAWKVRVEVPGGGLVAYEDQYQFQAPESGYAPTIEYDMPASGIDGKWRDRLEQTYFVKLANGNYARINFRMIAGGAHFAVVESFYNPSGSQNLEYDPNITAQK